MTFRPWRRRPAGAAGRPAIPQGMLVMSIVCASAAAGNSLIAPSIPAIAVDFELSTASSALLLSSYAVGRILATPICGRATNALGLRLVAAVGCGLSGFAAAVAIVWPSYILFLSSQLVQGVAAAVVMTAGLTAAVEMADQGAVGRSLSLFNGLVVAAMLAAPAIGGLAGQVIGITGPFWVAAVANLLSVILALLILSKALLVTRAPSRSSNIRRDRRRQLRRIVYSRAFVLSSAAAFAMVWSVGAVRNTLLPLLAISELKMNSAGTGALLTVGASAGLVVLMIAGRLIDKYGCRGMVWLGTSILAAGTAALGAATVLWVLVPILLITEAARSLLVPVQVTVVADITPTDLRANAVASSRLSNSFGSAAGPAMAGLIVDVYGVRPALLLAGGFLGIIALLCSQMPETRRGIGST